MLKAFKMFLSCHTRQSNLVIFFILVALSFPEFQSACMLYINLGFSVFKVLVLFLKC